MNAACVMLIALAAVTDAETEQPPAQVLEGREIELIPDVCGEARLHPGRIVLERMLLGEDDSTWVSETFEIYCMTRFWSDGARPGVPDSLLPAPAPMTMAHAFLFLPGAIESGRSVLCITSENTFTYSFDHLGRTVEVDWDPVADSGVYRFRYWYEPSDDPPEWID